MKERYRKLITYLKEMYGEIIPIWIISAILFLLLIVFIIISPTIPTIVIDNLIVLVLLDIILSALLTGSMTFIALSIIIIFYAIYDKLKENKKF